MSATQVDLLRHGEPEGGSKYRGQSDDPLSPRGWQQMRDAVGSVKHWDVVVSSPLARCLAFAQVLADEHDLPLHVDERLKEVCFGVWEGRTKKEVEASAPGTVARFYRDPVGNRPEGAEPLTAFRDRVMAGWEALLERHAGARVLLVTHAGVIRMVVGGVLGAPLARAYRIQVPYAGVTRVLVREGDWPQLLFHAGTVHLPDHSAAERAAKQGASVSR